MASLAINVASNNPVSKKSEKDSACLSRRQIKAKDESSPHDKKSLSLADPHESNGVKPNTDNQVAAQTHPECIGDIPWAWLHFEKWRLCTFCKYPENCCKSPILLAADGFVYIGTGGYCVICYFCKVEYSNWQPRDDIRQVHCRLSPNCPMVCGISYDNKPYRATDHTIRATFESLIVQKHNSTETNQQNVTSPVQLQSSCDVAQGPPSVIAGLSLVHVIDKNEDFTGNFAKRSPGVGSGQSPDNEINESDSANQSLAGSGQSTEIGTSENSGRSSTSCSDSSIDPNSSSESEDGDASPFPAGVDVRYRPWDLRALEKIENCACYPPKHTNYTKECSREKSFPKDHRLDGRLWATAGFFFKGIGDCVRCFYCGGGLRNLKSDDDPWVEHARRHPKCAFVERNKGKEFIHTVQTLKREQERISYNDVMRAIANGRDPSHASQGRQCSHVQENNSQSRPDSTCIQCRTKQRACVFCPCGHLVCCELCAIQTVSCPVDDCEKKVERHFLIAASNCSC